MGNEELRVRLDNLKQEINIIEDSMEDPYVNMGIGISRLQEELGDLMQFIEDSY